MPSFESFFAQSKGQPIQFAGRTVQMVDRIHISSGQEIKLRFLASKSHWRQGVYLTADGGFMVNGNFLKKAVVLWQDTAPAEVLFQVQSKKGEFQVRNVWDVGDGVMHSWHNGGAMILEQSNNVRRYHCNDGEPDEDFDDLVFTLEIIT